MGVIERTNVIEGVDPKAVRGAASRYTYEEFETIPRVSKNDGYSDPTGSTGDVNLLQTERNIFEYHIKGAGQTILKPGWDADGLDISLDQTNDEGAEYSQGITARSKAAFVARAEAFFLKVQFAIADVSGTDDCAVGFRKAAAYQANIDDYTDMAVLNVISGDIFIETILNNAATTSTDTTNNWADGETHTLEIYVSKTGAATYKIDGAAPTTVAAFTFDDGDVLVPFFFFLHAADVAGAVQIKSWECGLQ